MRSMLVVLAFVLAQNPDAPVELPPPPPMLAPADATPPVVDPATPPATTTTTPPDAADGPPVLPTPDVVAPKKPAPPPPVEGYDAFMTALMQAGSGAGIAVGLLGVIQLLGFLPAVIPGISTVLDVLGCVYCCILPVGIGLFETALGNSVGKRRAAALWPTLAACASWPAVIGIGCGVIGLFFGALVVEATSLDVDGFINAANDADGIAVTFIVLSILQPILMGVLPALTYAVIAEDKYPGDAGKWEMPGWLEPNHPPLLKPVKSKKSNVDVRAMRY